MVTKHKPKIKRSGYRLLRTMGHMLDSKDRRLSKRVGSDGFGGITVERLKRTSRRVRESKSKFSFNGYMLSVRQALFLHYLTNADNEETFMDKKMSLINAGYTVKDDHNARGLAKQLMEAGEVKRALADYFNDEEILDLINAGARHKLRDFDDRDWVKTATFVAKCRGDFVHNRDGVGGMTKQERDARLSKIEEMVGSEPILIVPDDGEDIDG